MKTKKLNLKELKVDSFITSLEGKDSHTIKAGSTPGCGGAAVVAIAASAVATFAMGVVIGATIVAIVENTKK